MEYPKLDCTTKTQKLKLKSTRRLAGFFLNLNLQKDKFYDIIKIMKKSLWFWLCFICAIIFAVYFSVRIVMTGMGRGRAAYINNISISADQSDKDLSAIVTAVT